jgi:hypothetical protein
MSFKEIKQDLEEKLQNLSIEKLSELHEILGLSEEHGFKFEGRMELISHIFKKDKQEILEALEELKD